jgi:glycosyltransferase involved in cell wall biosynthesis
MAAAFRSFREMGLPGGVDLWLFDITTPGIDRLFYLPFTGIDANGITELHWDGPVDEPFAFLPPFMARRAQAIHHHLVRRRPKVVHAWLDMANLCAAAAALVAGVPKIVLHNHNMRPTTLEVDRAMVGWEECYRLLLEREEVLLVNCAQAGIDDYLSWMGSERRERTRVVLNGFDFEPFDHPHAADERARLRAELDIAPDALVVGTALRFEDVKRPFRWLDAAALVHRDRPDTRFVLYGDGRLRAACLDHAEAIGLGDAVRMPGRVADIHRRLPILDLFVLSSSSEGLPNVLIEAQAAGVPVISYDIGGVAETLLPDVTGLLVKDDSAEALAAAVLRAAADPTWRATASRTAQPFVRERFSLAAMIDQLVEIVGGRPGGRRPPEPPGPPFRSRRGCAASPARHRAFTLFR